MMHAHQAAQAIRDANLVDEKKALECFRKCTKQGLSLASGRVHKLQKRLRRKAKAEAEAKLKLELQNQKLSQQGEWVPIEQQDATGASVGGEGAGEL